MAINWILYTDAVTGQGHPSLPDILNRPVRDLLADSGYAADGSNWAGFAKASHVHSAADITSGTLGVARGGTGVATVPTGNLLLGAAAAALIALAPGAAGGYVRSDGSTWARAAGVAASDLTGNLAYAALPSGSGSWDAGVGNTTTFTRNVAVSGSLTATLLGNASTATALQSARTIWGQSFDGTGNVAGALSSVTTIAATGLITVTKTSDGVTVTNGTQSLSLGMNWGAIATATYVATGGASTVLVFGINGGEAARITTAGLAMNSLAISGITALTTSGLVSAGGGILISNANPIIQFTDTSGPQSAFIDYNTGTSLKIHAGPDAIDFIAGSTSKWLMAASGGFYAAGATGGDKGNGSINVSADIYKNNTAYTNPDYVFEAIFTGDVKKFLGNPGARAFRDDFMSRGGRIRTIDEDRAYAREHLHLPGIGRFAAGAFDRADMALQEIETTRVYVWQLHDRITEMEHGKASTVS